MAKKNERKKDGSGMAGWRRMAGWREQFKNL